MSASASERPILQVKDLCKVYGAGDNRVTALDHVNLTVRRGEFVSIVGSVPEDVENRVVALRCAGSEVNVALICIDKLSDLSPRPFYSGRRLTSERVHAGCIAVEIIIGMHECSDFVRHAGRTVVIKIDCLSIHMLLHRS